MFRSIVFLIALIAAPLAHAGTLVSLNTPVGALTLELYDDAKPITVGNFLTYLQSGRYTNSFAHRLDPGFVLQGGGFTIDGTSIFAVPTDPPILNEFTSDPLYSNTKGTIAMAKVGGDPNSATSQWFINLADNTGLDFNNGGFTVFGRVIEGLDLLDIFNDDFNDQANGGQGVYDASPPNALNSSLFTELPLLANTLAIDNFIFTEFAIIPEPTPLATILTALAALGLISLGKARITNNQQPATSNSPTTPEWHEVKEFAPTGQRSPSPGQRPG